MFKTKNDLPEPARVKLIELLNAAAGRLQGLANSDQTGTLERQGP